MENQEILKALYRIIELQEEALKELKKQAAVPTASKTNQEIFEDLVDSFTVRQKLGISVSTLYRIKISETVSTKRVGKRDYYSLSEITAIVNFYKK